MSCSSQCHENIEPEPLTNSVEVVMPANGSLPLSSNMAVLVGVSKQFGLNKNVDSGKNVELVIITECHICAMSFVNFKTK